MHVSILLIEGKSSLRPSFHKGLVDKGYEVISVPNGSRALESLNSNTPDIFLVDSASMRTSGKRICQSLKDRAPETPIIIIVDQKTQPHELFNAEVVLTEPFTIKKLVNRIQTFSPNNQKYTLKVGPFELDEDLRLARCANKQSRLTPRMIALLKRLMEKPGEDIDRRTLFSDVWETEYLGDTRPLDVHISWLRQRLEEDPRKPKYIKTIRGVGYRLDIEPDTSS